MKSLFEGFVVSLGYFSQLSLPYRVQEMDAQRNRYLLFSLPFVGIILAAIMIAFYHLMSLLGHEVYMAIVAAVLYLFLYGFLHIEGLVDIIDAYYAKHAEKDVREVLKEPHIGAMGMIAAVSFVILKVSILAYLLHLQAYWHIVSVLFASRLMIVVAVYHFDFHQESLFLQALKESLSTRSVAVFMVLALSIMIMFGDVIVLFFAIISGFLIKHWLVKKIGFLNGDGMGFMIEINELILFHVVLLLCI